MQSAFNKPPVLRLSLIAVACQLACLSLSAHGQTTSTDAAAPASEMAAAPAPAKNAVVVKGKKLGMGLMVNEDAPKARSTITAEELAKERPTGNVYDALDLLPSVNTYNYDATGLFGGGLTLRGFNSDQIGATINGVPVNDSGAFAVYPMEYVDQENTCSQTVTQGSTDVDSPQVGATGGNFNVTTCEPEDKMRTRYMQTFGQLNMSKEYLRFDSGYFSDKRTKFFVSYSHTEADKWKGKGGADRDHIDLGVNYDIDKFNYIHGIVLYNKMRNNNILSPTLAQLKANGYDADYSSTYTGNPAAVAGKTTAVSQSPAYYGLALNPFEDIVASVTAKFRLTENLDLKVLPYYWYGYGNGGTQQKVITEASGFFNPATGKAGSAGDLNGDGDTNDAITVASASVTRTSRPGVTTSLTYNIGNNQILGGFWYERANHEQTQPAVAVDANGNPTDDYLQDNQIRGANGIIYQGRDWKTASTAYQAFLQDTLSLMDDKLTLNAGIRLPHVKRDFTNYPSVANNSGTYYRIIKSYSEPLPQIGLRYRLTSDDQLFASLAKNMKAPPNYTYAPTNANVVLKNGVPVLASDVKEETSWDLDVGWRHQTDKIISSVSVYAINFKNRQATATDLNTLTSVLTNVGTVKNQGLEAEIGNTPIGGWAFYGSFGYSKSEIKDNLQSTATAQLPTKGKVYPLTPKFKAGLSAEYADGPFFARLKMKATAKQYATLVNDEEVPGYTVFGFDSGYTFKETSWLKRPRLMLNITNLFSKEYRNPSSQTNNALAYGSIAAASAVQYYLAAPRFTSVTFSADF